jgi:hypothetical protein
MSTSESWRPVSNCSRIFNSSEIVLDKQIRWLLAINCSSTADGFEKTVLRTTLAYRSAKGRIAVGVMDCVAYSLSRRLRIAPFHEAFFEVKVLSPVQDGSSVE